ncbi:MAG: type III-B CRISPR-associated protein Cas10/Cmr2 [Candidatus Spyradenecus sp.]
MAEEALLLFQLGPVQGFIAQAQEVSDLWAGSRLLSQVTFAALKAVQDYRAKVVFPADAQDDEGIPNRFLVFVPRAQAAEIARAAEAAARAKLTKLAEAALSTPELSNVSREAFLAQVRVFLQTSWAILPEPCGKMGEDYKAIGKRLAARRNVRAFNAWHERTPGALKDVLSGKEEALQDGLGAMNLIKRTLLRPEGTWVLPKEEKYLAVLMMDGDKMGETLSKFQTQAEHQDFSRKLKAFAGGVQAVVEAQGGTLIYAGGDDVLAVLPATRALACARDLREAFHKQVGGDVSAGLAVGSTKVPLQLIIEAARQAEHRAKHDYGRSALALTVLKRSGEELRWGAKWEERGMVLFADLLEAHRGKENKESRFAYKLAGFLQPYFVDGKLPGHLRDVVRLETEHTLAQTALDNKEKWEAEVLETLKAWPEERLADFLNLFLCETFISRNREDNV